MKYDVAIIGAGPAGYTAAESAAREGLSVVLFEKKQLGGVCLNEGCIPTKTLLYAAKLVENVGNSSRYGVRIPEVSYDLPKMMVRKNKVVHKLVLGIKGRLSAAGVNFVEGEAWIEDRHTIRCNDEFYSFENLILCTGSVSFIPPIPGLDSVDYWTHREALDPKIVPGSLTVIGGGVIGIEFASFYHTLGSKVTVIEMTEEILPGADPEIAALLRKEYERKGAKFLLHSQVLEVEKRKEQLVVICAEEWENREVIGDKLLISTGRKVADTGYGLEKLSLKKKQKGIPDP
ncbi:MAG: FAD-dependent oxidoreductase [Bacteroides sp.]|nr:FAD-dependent oxidoreductase [Bacteroides sp.]